MLNFLDFSSYRKHTELNKILFLDFLTHEDGTYRLSRNIGKELTLYAV